MKKQIIISIEREFGSGGHQIARDLAAHFNLPLYDKNILDDIAREKGVDPKDLEKFDEVPKNRLFSRSLEGHTSSPQEALANMQFDFIRGKAESGESFVVVGRCGSYILREYDGLIKVFISADMPVKAERVAEFFEIDTTKAEDIINKNNRKRKSYHNFYCKTKWGDSRNYELLVNTSKIGIDAASDVVKNYIQHRIDK